MFHLLFTFVSVGNVLQEGFHSLDNLWRVDDFGFGVETANPCVKLLADFNMSRHNKMPTIVRAVENLFAVAEALHGGVQEVVGEADADELILTAEHGEDALGVSSHVNLFVNLSAVPRLSDDFHFLHAVKAVGSHVLLVAVVCQEVVVAVVDEQFEGTADVRLSASSGDLVGAIIQGVLQVLETDFPLRLDYRSWGTAQ